MKSQTERMTLQSNEFDAADNFADSLRKLNMTPIVDDDYPEMRHKFENSLTNFIEAMRLNERFKEGNRYNLIEKI